VNIRMDDAEKLSLQAIAGFFDLESIEHGCKIGTRS